MAQIVVVALDWISRMNYLNDIARLIEMKDSNSLKDCLRESKGMKKDSSVMAYIPFLQKDRFKLEVGGERRRQFFLH